VITPNNQPATNNEDLFQERSFALSIVVDGAVTESNSEISPGIPYAEECGETEVPLSTGLSMTSGLHTTGIEIGIKSITAIMIQLTKNIC
jgi:hypothetical protein